MRSSVESGNIVTPLALMVSALSADRVGLFKLPLAREIAAQATAKRALSRKLYPSRKLYTKPAIKPSSTPKPSTVVCAGAVDKSFSILIAAKYRFIFQIKSKVVLYCRCSVITALTRSLSSLIGCPHKISSSFCVGFRVWIRLYQFFTLFALNSETVSTNIGSLSATWQRP